MSENIVMPQLGESIAEGTIVKWLKNPGDTVQKDENIILISTDKVEAEIPSPADGVLVSIDVEAGKTVPVGTVLGVVGDAGSKAEAKTKEQEEKPKKSDKETPSQEKKSLEKEEPKEEEQAPRETSDKPKKTEFLSPLVRRIIKENNLSEKDLQKIARSGRDERITKKDVLDYLENKQSQEEEKPKSEVKASEEEVSEVGEREEKKPISTMRRVIMENMVASKMKSAHVTTFFEVDYTAIDAVRILHKDVFFKEEQVPLTYTTFLAMAICQVLKRHPYINATIAPDGIIFKKDIHLGIAVAIESPEPGLMVPVIKNADKQNLRGLAHAIADLSARVRSRKIRPDELSGGSFTITNPGTYGAIIGTPIINQPQVAILGVGQIKKQPVVLESYGQDVIAIRRMGWLSLSFDHRLIDGATADIFMADLKRTLEGWNTAP